MSVFKRANWHSGLTYRQSCPECKTEVTYKDDKLGFRPWFADGFIYCPKCEKPLRHNEDYAIDKPDKEVIEKVDLTKPSTDMYCTSCGAKLSSDHKFCPQCGTKRQ